MRMRIRMIVSNEDFGTPTDDDVDDDDDSGNDPNYSESKSESANYELISADKIMEMNHKALRRSIKKWIPNKTFQNRNADTF